MSNYNDAYILTVSGNLVHFLDPQQEDIEIEDIAHSLARTIRWGGHTHTALSVAQHSVNVSRIVKANGGNEATQLHALLHDGSEAYIADLPRPVKAHCRDYQEIEDHLQAVIYQTFGLEDHHLYRKMTDRADLEAMSWEARDLFDNEGRGVIPLPEFNHPHLQAMCYIEAEEAFLDLFDTLIEGDNEDA